MCQKLVPFPISNLINKPKESLHARNSFKNKKSTAMNPWHLKVKESNQKLLHHYQQSKNQLDSPKDPSVSFWLSWILTASKKSVIPPVHFGWSPVTGLASPIFYHTHPINFWSAFSFCDSWDTPNFIVQRPDWPYSFLTMPNQKNFQSTSNFCEFVSTS